MVDRKRYNRLKKFAIEAGVNVYRDQDAYEFAVGGKYSYNDADNPRFNVCGFRTKAEAYEHWCEGTFGPKTAQAFYKLLDNQRR